MIVALHPEGVDRNHRLSKVARVVLASPSTRRAWIEIPPYIVLYHNPKCRPPPGGRG